MMSASQAILYCTCCNTLDAVIPPAALEEKLRAHTAAPHGAAPDDPALRLCGANAAVFVRAERLCRKEEAHKALEAAKKAGVTQLVVAACSSLARGVEVMRHLGPSMPLEWVDVREGCAWVHAHHPAEAVEKAADLIRMGLAALRHTPATPPQAPPVPLPHVLVVGGGPAGLAAAASAGHAGGSVTLVERGDAVGGLLRRIDRLFPHNAAAPALLEDLHGDMAGLPVEVRLHTTVTALRPDAEGFTATLHDKKNETVTQVRAGAVVLAAGALPVLPRGHFRYGELSGVGSQMELELALGKVERSEAPPDSLPRRAVFVQCVAARDAHNPYCSAICCPTALKNALRLRNLVPDATVTIAHRNIVTPGASLEALYRRATQAGVLLRNYDAGHPPRPLGDSRLEGVEITDALTGERTVLPADMLVCSTPLTPAPGTKKLADALGIHVDDMGFACGREPVFPLQPHTPGVFICGSARWPASVDQSVEQGQAAGMQAAIYLRTPQAGTWTGPNRAPAVIQAEKCSNCGRCGASCPYGACVPSTEAHMRVLPRLCASCGVCAAVCPTGAAFLADDSLWAMRARVKEAMGGYAL